jgi:acetyl-CoA synthetase
MSTDAVENLLHENRHFPPSAQFAAQANAQPNLYELAQSDRIKFWEAQAERLDWDTRWHQVLDWSRAPFANWFVGGKLNVSYNCVDRHVLAGNGDRVALYWEGEPGDSRVITYAQLQTEVSKAANALISLGVTVGDRVAIYLPMIP